jgi:hypothetical protein
LPHTVRQQQGRFIQVLEGDRTEVDGVYSRILKDNRHQDLIVLQEDFTASRHFENWAMGFKNTPSYKITAVILSNEPKEITWLTIPM